MRGHARLVRLLSALVILIVPLAGASACGGGDDADGMEGTVGSMEGSRSGSGATAAENSMAETELPPGEEGAMAALEESPRHGEWVDVSLPGSNVPIRTWAVYPERSDPAPVVIVIQEIYGLTDWIRSVADQLAADGFIALAPDLLSGMGPEAGGTESFGSRDDVVAAVRNLSTDEAVTRLDAVRSYALEIPAASGEVGTVGYCWGGSTSFSYAVHQPELGAAVVYYGTSPSEEADYERISAPVLGLYGEDDERVNSTIPMAREAMDVLDKTYEVEIYDGAGHGFLRAQDGREGANLRATEQAWPRTVEFFRDYLEG